MNPPCGQPRWTHGGAAAEALKLLPGTGLSHQVYRCSDCRQFHINPKGFRATAIVKPTSTAAEPSGIRALTVGDPR